MILSQKLLSIDRYNEIINESKNISDANIQKLTFELINLKKSFELIINNSVDGYWEWDLISNKTYISESLKEILGAEINEYEGNFIETENLVHPFDRDIRNQIINDSLSDFSDYTFEYRLLCKDHKYYYFLAKGTYLKDENGKAIKLVGSLININNQKINQQELRLKDYVIKNTLTPVVWLNKDGNFVNANKAYLELVGYTFEELLNLHVKEVDENFSEEIWKDHWIDLKANKTLFLVAKSKGKDGTYIDIQITANYVKIDDIELNCAFVQDITEKLKLEKEIIESGIRFQKLLNDIPNIAIHGYDKDGNIFYWNNASEKLYDYTKEEAINSNIFELVTPVEFREKIIKERNYMFENKTTFPNKEAIVQNKSGEKINVLSTNSYLELNENTQHLYCFDVDLTEINTARNQIKDLVDELTNKNSELETIIKDKDKLFSIIAHDLRSPLSGFMALTKELSENLDNLEESEIQEFTTVLNISSENVYNLLENLLNWSQFQRGLINCQPEEIYFNYIITSNVNLLSKKINDKNITVINKSDGPHLFSADLQMNNTIIRNLLTNAIKFSYPNSVIEIGVIDVDINRDIDSGNDQKLDKKLNEKDKHFIEKYYKKNHFTFYIKDFGMGMPENIINNLGIFSNKTKRYGTLNESSSGLGCVITYDFVRAHNGNIFVESEEEKGSTFIIQLPNKK